jgi:hypothetical protein
LEITQRIKKAIDTHTALMINLDAVLGSVPQKLPPQLEDFRREHGWKLARFHEVMRQGRDVLSAVGERLRELEERARSVPELDDLPRLEVLEQRLNDIHELLVRTIGTLASFNAAPRD